MIGDPLWLAFAGFVLLVAVIAAKLGWLDPLLEVADAMLAPEHESEGRR